MIKYLLEKHWIFDERSTGVYTAMGVVTTVIFWWTETAFWLIWKTDTMRELGAVLGPAVGYVVKYDLDRRYVFYNLDRRYVFTNAQISL